MWLGAALALSKARARAKAKAAKARARTVMMRWWRWRGLHLHHLFFFDRFSSAATNVSVVTGPSFWFWVAVGSACGHP